MGRVGLCQSDRGRGDLSEKAAKSHPGLALENPRPPELEEGAGGERPLPALP